MACRHLLFASDRYLGLVTITVTLEIQFFRCFLQILTDVYLEMGG